MERTILHSDLNNFFASVECKLNPSLNGHPVAVAGDPEKRHGIVLAKNYEAKKFNVKTGEALWQAKLKCPDIIFVAPHYDKYEEFSKNVKSIYADYTDMIEPYGMDECWLDVTQSRNLFGDGVTIADTIRNRVKKELGVTVSIGVSFNKIFAKLGSDMKKPDAITVIDREHFKEIVWPLNIEEMLYVGRATKERLNRYGIMTIGQIAALPIETMRFLLGVNGENLWLFANGLDMSPVAYLDSYPLIKSVSCGNTAHRDLVCDEDIQTALLPLCIKVSSRLRKYGFLCETVMLYIRDSDLSWCERQKKLFIPCRTYKEIYKAVYELYKANHLSGAPVRSLSVRATNLVYNEEYQLSLEEEVWKIQRREYLEKAVDRMKERYGENAVFPAVYLKDSDVVSLHIHSGVEHSMPGMFFRG